MQNNYQYNDCLVFIQSLNDPLNIHITKNIQFHISFLTNSRADFAVRTSFFDQKSSLDLSLLIRWAKNWKL